MLCRRSGSPFRMGETGYRWHRNRVLDITSCPFWCQKEHLRVLRTTITYGLNRVLRTRITRPRKRALLRFVYENAYKRLCTGSQKTPFLMTKPGTEYRILCFCCILMRILRGFRPNNNCCPAPRCPKPPSQIGFLNLPPKLNFDPCFTV